MLTQPAAWPAWRAQEGKKLTQKGYSAAALPRVLTGRKFRFPLAKREPPEQKPAIPPHFLLLSSHPPMQGE